MNLIDSTVHNTKISSEQFINLLSEETIASIVNNSRKLYKLLEETSNFDERKRIIIRYIIQSLVGNIALDGEHSDTAFLILDIFESEVQQELIQWELLRLDFSWTWKLLDELLTQGSLEGKTETEEIKEIKKEKKRLKKERKAKVLAKHRTSEA